MISILRLGHRLHRDDRISTHCGLVARALGAQEIIYSGDKDDKMIEGVERVKQRFGGRFAVSYQPNWRKVITNFKKKHYTLVHLTCYGLPLQKKITSIKKNKKLLVIVGSEKVPGEVYQESDYNIAVTSQPHSEIAALALFIEGYLGKKALTKTFPKAKVKIIPQERGKKVID